MSKIMENIKKILRPVYAPIMNAIHAYRKGAKRYHHLFDEIEKNKATTILEVGTWNGQRAKKMIATAQRASGEQVGYVGFDLFEDLTEDMYQYELSKKPPTRKEVEQDLKKTGADIKLIQGNTLQTLVDYVKKASKVDFIFIDGGHKKETVLSDWKAVSSLMHEKTVVIFDDYWHNREDESAKSIVDNIDRSKYWVEVLPEIDIFENPDFGHLEISFAKVQLLKLKN
jgi:predicted O-methyltransferase YrrM